MRRRRAGRRAPRMLPLALAGAVLTAGRARADDGTEHYVLRAELGSEYDSNVHHTEVVDTGKPVARTEPLVGSALARGVLSGTLTDVVSDRQDVAISATTAGKLFAAPEARSENVAVAQAGINWRVRLGERSAVAASGAYYEAFQSQIDPEQRRDFQSLAPALRLAFRAGDRTEVGIGAGYRWFLYKPARDFDFEGPSAGLDLRWTREAEGEEADWDLLLGAGFERRAYASKQQIPELLADPTQDIQLVYGTEQRIDNFFTARAEVVRTGRVLLGAGYALHRNVSNSYSETVTRHAITGRLAAALPWELFLTARADLVLAYYAQAVLVVPNTTMPMPGSDHASIEEENRSTVRGELSRAISDRVQIIARYTYYAPPLTGSMVSYNRHTALLSLAFTLER